MDWVLGKVEDIRAHETGFEVSPTRRCSFLTGLQINSLALGRKVQAANEL